MTSGDAIGARRVLPISTALEAHQKGTEMNHHDDTHEMHYALRGSAIGAILVTLVTAALMLGAALLTAPAHATETPTPASWVTDAGTPVDLTGAPACEGEGQEYGPCVWDASTAGNGKGKGFLLEEDGSVTYIHRAGTDDATVRPGDGTATATPAKKGKKSKKKSSEEYATGEYVAPADESAEARAYPGWDWTGKTAAHPHTGLPHCVDVSGGETCWRDGYVLIVDSHTCTQAIIADSGDQYVPGPAVQAAISDACSARKADGRPYSDDAGLGGARAQKSPTATPAPAVSEPTATSTPREAVVAPSASLADTGTPDNFDHGLIVIVILIGLGYGAVRWARSRGGRSVGRHGRRRW